MKLNGPEGGFGSTGIFIIILILYLFIHMHIVHGDIERIRSMEGEVEGNYGEDWKLSSPM